MALRNRVDPFGDLHEVAARGLLTGNRGCLVDDEGALVRHHSAPLWIACVTAFRGRRQPLRAPRRWTPVFFLDDAVALAAGHRPCGECRRAAYTAYREAVGRARGGLARPWARELDRLLAPERLRGGRGIDRGRDRIVWRAQISGLPDGTVVLGDRRAPQLLLGARTLTFGFDGWRDPRPRARRGEVDVLTPPTSVGALAHGFAPLLHQSASG